MEISRYQKNEKTFFSVYADKSTSNGILRFGHEIDVVFVEENGKLKFYSA